MTRRRTEGFDHRLTLPLVLGSVLNPVNSSMIAVSLVPIGAAFGEPVSRTAWLVSALYLATAVGQPVVGRLVDLFGPRRLYLVATALVGVAGVIGLLAQSLDWLIVSRVLLGLGTCSAFPAAMYLIRSEADRTGVSTPTTVLTLLSVANQAVVVVGPTLGGLLIGLGGWRLIFAVNLPLSVACLVLGALRLPRHTRADDEPRTGLDVTGMALFAVLLTALMFFLMSPAWERWWLLAISLAAAGLLTWRELGVSSPFLDLRVLGGDLPLLATYARGVLTSTVTYCFLYGFTQWLEDGRELSAAHAGLLLLPMSVTAMVISFVSGRSPELWLKLVVGGVALLLGCAAILTVGSGTGIWFLAAIAVCVGVAQGTISLANQNAVYHQADPARMGSAAGLLRTFMYLGAIVSSAAVASFFGARADTGGLHQLAWFMVGCVVLLLVISVFDGALRRTSRRLLHENDGPVSTDPEPRGVHA